MRVLGIDPGSRFTGFGLLDWVQGNAQHVHHGVVTLNPQKPLSERLGLLSEGLEQVVRDYAPTVAAVEQVFTAHNVRSAIVLAQARGAVLAVLGRAGVPVFEYAAAEVKTTVTGYGRADKQQMQKMVSLLLGIHTPAVHDASDALAVGLCHLRNARLTAQAAMLRSVAR